MNLGQRIDHLYQLREQKRKLEADLKELREKMEEDEIEIFEMLKNNGTSTADGLNAKVSITETIVPVIDDADEFFDHVLATGDIHLLERRVSSRAYRELLEAGEEVPGLRPFNRRTLSLRTK